MSNVPDRIWIYRNDRMFWSDSQLRDEDAVSYRRDDQVCVWRVCGDGYSDQGMHGAAWRTANVKQWTYCPFCGNRIQVEEA